MSLYTKRISSESSQKRLRKSIILMCPLHRPTTWSDASTAPTGRCAGDKYKPAVIPHHRLSDNLELGEFQQELLLPSIAELDGRLGVLACPFEPQYLADPEPLVFDHGSYAESCNRSR